MDGPSHYREAERRLLMAWEEGRDPANSAHLVAEAQVHATLALAAATAVQPAGYGSSNPVWQAWEDATKTQSGPFYMSDRVPGQVEPAPAGIRVIEVERGTLVTYPEWNDGEPVKVLGVEGAGLEGRLVAVSYTFFGARDGEEVAVVSADTLVTPYGGAA